MLQDRIPVSGLPIAGLLVAGQSDTAIRPNINCTCRFLGKDFLIGESACIRGALATCSTYLNNTSWSITKEPCPIALNTPALFSPKAREFAGG